MGISRYYICDKCDWKQRLSEAQPRYGADRFIEEKYCPKTDQIIHVYSDWDDDTEDISCVEMKKRRSRRKRAGIANCHIKKCDGRCLKDLVVLEYDDNNVGAVSYKCPRTDCGGVMHVDHESGYIIGH